MSDAVVARSELPPGWPDVLRAVVAAPTAWISRNDLARELELDDKRGRPLKVLARRLDEMIAAKWLAEWQLGITLTPLAEARLGCRLTQPESPTEEPRWIMTGAMPWPRVVREPGFVSEWIKSREHGTDQIDEFSVIAYVPAPDPPPPEQAIAAEEFRAEVAAAIRDLVERRNPTRAQRLLDSRPRIILTGCNLVWTEQTVEPGDEFKPRPYCEVCCRTDRDEEWYWRLPIKDQVICARCLSWFLDGFFAWKPAKYGDGRAA